MATPPKFTPMPPSLEMKVKAAQVVELEFRAALWNKLNLLISVLTEAVGEELEKRKDQ